MILFEGAATPYTATPAVEIAPISEAPRFDTILCLRFHFMATILQHTNYFAENPASISCMNLSGKPKVGPPSIKTPTDPIMKTIALAITALSATTAFAMAQDKVQITYSGMVSVERLSNGGDSETWAHGTGDVGLRWPTSSGAKIGVNLGVETLHSSA